MKEQTRLLQATVQKSSAFLIINSSTRQPSSVSNRTWVVCMGALVACLGALKIEYILIILLL